MKIIEAIAKRIKELQNEHNLVTYGLACLCGVGDSTLRDILNLRYSSVNLSIILDLCDGLNLELKDFFSRDYFLLENLET